MPRKRRTRVVMSGVSSPSGNEASSSSGDEKQQRNESIDLYLKDFDMKVANYMAQARDEAKMICSAINSAFTMEIMKLPKKIREMTIGEYMARGGSINNTALEGIAEATDSIASSISAKLTTTVPHGNTEEAASKTTKTTKTTKKGAKGRKKTAATKTSKRSAQPQSVLTNNQEINTQEATETQTVRRSSRRKTARTQYVTPATKMGKLGAQTTGWDTPMITPKFDPRLPVTPATCVMREAKRGETVISLSGSPITMPSQRDMTKPEAVIPLADGSALMIGTSSPQVDMAMDETTRKNILLLQSNLAKILKKCPVQSDG